MLTPDAWRGEILMRWSELKSAAKKTGARFRAAPLGATLSDYSVVSRTDQKAGFRRILERAVLTLVDELLAMTYCAAEGGWFCLSHAWKPSGKAVSPLPRHVLL